METGGITQAGTPRYSFILWDSDSRWERLHAFDAEVSAHLIVLGTRLGISPGELADFLLGWFGIDIAGDDRAGGDGPHADDVEVITERADENLEEAGE